MQSKDFHESSLVLQFKKTNSLVLILLYGPLSHLYMTTRETIASTIQIFVGKVMSLLFNKLSRFVMVFLPRSKCLLISWLQSLSTVILETKKIKSATVSTSVQFSHSVVSDSLRPNGLQHTRPACPSPTSGVYSNSCPLSP